MYKAEKIFSPGSCFLKVICGLCVNPGGKGRLLFVCLMFVFALCVIYSKRKETQDRYCGGGALRKIVEMGVESCSICSASGLVLFS